MVEGARRRGPLFGIDTMVVIYHFEGGSELAGPAGELLRSAESGQCRLVTSVLARLETLVVPTRHGHEPLLRHYRSFFDLFPNLELVPVDEAIADLAAELRATLNLRTPDALHLATALQRGANAFVTEDQRHFPDAVEGLRVIGIEQALALAGE